MLQGMCGNFPASVLGIVANFRPSRMAPSVAGAARRDDLPAVRQGYSIP